MKMQRRASRWPNHTGEPRPCCQECGHIRERHMMPGPKWPNEPSRCDALTRKRGHGMQYLVCGCLKFVKETRDQEAGR